MPPINDDILTCILAHLDDLHPNARSEKTLCNLALTCRQFRKIVTAELYRYPFLSVPKLLSFATTITNDAILASFVRGVTVDLRARPASHEESNTVHRTACAAIRDILKSAHNLDALAANPRGNWRLDPDMDYSPSDSTTNIFHAFFGYSLEHNRHAKQSTIKHLYLTGTWRRFVRNIWRTSHFANETVLRGGCSLTVHDMPNRGDLLCLPPHSGSLDMRISFVGCKQAPTFYSGVLARYANCLAELYNRTHNYRHGGNPSSGTPLALSLPSLRLLETDTMQVPVLDVPALQELRVASYGIESPGQLQSWLTQSNIPALLHIVFEAYDGYSYASYSLTQAEHAKLLQDVHDLETLCRESEIRTEPSIREALQGKLAAATIVSGN